jgi:hypothetical protein
MKFTDEQIKAFRAYVKVQRSGRYNMLTPQAQRATGLAEKMYFFIMENYEALQKAAEETP